MDSVNGKDNQPASSVDFTSSSSPIGVTSAPETISPIDFSNTSTESSVATPSPDFTLGSQSANEMSSPAAPSPDFTLGSQSASEMSSPATSTEDSSMIPPVASTEDSSMIPPVASMEDSSIVSQETPDEEKGEQKEEEGKSLEEPVITESNQMVKDKKVVDEAATFRKKLTNTKKRLPMMDDSEKDDIRNKVITEFINILKISKHATTRKKMGRRINNLRNVFNETLDMLNGTAKKRNRKRKTKKQQMVSPAMENTPMAEVPIENTENPPTESFSENQS